MRARALAFALTALTALAGCPRTDGGATVAPVPAPPSAAAASAAPSAEPAPAATASAPLATSAAPSASAEPASSLVPVPSASGDQALEALRRHCEKGKLEDWQKEQCRALFGEPPP